jgi:2-C-methyl-D-erythritol 2,4-cyclodiphosphate synthase
MPALRRKKEKSTRRKAEVRFGFGYDVHPLVVGRKLILGGVEIVHDRGLQGHSDADVLLHAICDALLGAAALGDIGHHFPNNDPMFKDISSLDLLRRVKAMLKRKGFSTVNVDATIVLEHPKIAQHVTSMKRRIAGALGVEPERISIKATTNEGIGFVGRGEGCAAYAVACIESLS